MQKVDASEPQSKLTVGVRDLKARLSAVLRDVGQGRRVLVTDRHEPVAELRPIARVPEGQEVAKVLQARIADHPFFHWNGGKPKGLQPGLPMKRASVSEAVLEDRR